MSGTANSLALPRFDPEKWRATASNLPALRSHQHRAFLGCFSCMIRKNIDWQGFLEWKHDPSKAPDTTRRMAATIAAYVDNKYDFLTACPPSTQRDPENYCCFKLCEELAGLTGVPFIRTFRQRENKIGHGRFASLRADVPIVVPGWSHSGKSILLVDDF